MHVRVTETVAAVCSESHSFSFLAVPVSHLCRLEAQAILYCFMVCLCICTQSHSSSNVSCKSPSFSRICNLLFTVWPTSVTDFGLDCCDSRV